MASTNEDQTRRSIESLLAQIKDFYRLHAPIALAGRQQVQVATIAQIAELEALIGEPLPEDYRQFLLLNDVRHSFSANFGCLDVREVGRVWQGMADLLDQGVFDDGRVERHKAQGFGNWRDGALTECWWSRRWIPLAEDSCGNLKCIDCGPGIKGVKYQIMAMEVQDGQGPFSTPDRSFSDYLEMHLEYLENGQFRLNDDGIEVDQYLKSRRRFDAI